MDELFTGQVLAFLMANYMNLATLYKIYLTIHVSSAQGEGTFNSHFKLLKTYLYATRGEERSLAICTTF